MDNAVKADLSKAVLDNEAARDFSPGLVPTDNSEHEHFVNIVGFVTLILCVFIFIAWAMDTIKLFALKRRVQLHEDHTPGHDVVSKGCDEKGHLEDEHCDKALEDLDILFPGQSKSLGARALTRPAIAPMYRWV